MTDAGSARGSTLAGTTPLVRRSGPAPLLRLPLLPDGKAVGAWVRSRPGLTSSGAPGIVSLFEIFGPQGEGLLGGLFPFLQALP